MKQNPIDVCEILYRLTDDDCVFDEETDLVEAGLMDSLLLIELLTVLEDEGVSLPLTRIDRSLLRTPAGIRQLVENATAGSLR